MAKTRKYRDFYALGLCFFAPRWSPVERVDFGCSYVIPAHGTTFTFEADGYGCFAPGFFLKKNPEANCLKFLALQLHSNCLSLFTVYIGAVADFDTPTY